MEEVYNWKAEKIIKSETDWGCVFRLSSKHCSKFVLVPMGPSDVRTNHGSLEIWKLSSTVLLCPYDHTDGAVLYEMDQTKTGTSFKLSLPEERALLSCIRKYYAPEKCKGYERVGLLGATYLTFVECSPALRAEAEAALVKEQAKKAVTDRKKSEPLKTKQMQYKGVVNPQRAYK